MSQFGQPPSKSNAGVAAAVLGSLAAIGGAVAIAAASRGKPAPRLGRARAPLKKPCGCGR